jgi:hypothetical protein
MITTSSLTAREQPVCLPLPHTKLQVVSLQWTSFYIVHDFYCSHNTECNSSSRSGSAETTIWTVKGKQVKLSLCISNLALCHEGIWRSGCIDPYFLNLDTSCRWVTSFMFSLIYSQGNSPQYQVSITWRRENSRPYRYSNSNPSVIQSVANR